MILRLDTAGPMLVMELRGVGGGAEKSVELGRTMARRILAELRDFLTENGVSWQDLTGLEVNEGPGSYTGLRIGLTVANTLAEALSIPVNGKKSPILPQYSTLCQKSQY